VASISVISPVLSTRDGHPAHFRAAFELEHGIEPGIVTLFDLLTGAEQVDAAGGDGAELQAARIAGLQLAEEFPPVGCALKRPQTWLICASHC
jgi:hypothetical protein